MKAWMIFLLPLLDAFFSVKKTRFPISRLNQLLCATLKVLRSTAAGVDIQ
jgi:hypothetical protein